MAYLSILIILLVGLSISRLVAKVNFNDKDEFVAVLLPAEDVQREDCEAGVFLKGTLSSLQMGYTHVAIAHIKLLAQNPPFICTQSSTGWSFACLLQRQMMRCIELVS